MAKKDSGIDKLFVLAEQQASDFELFPESESLTANELVAGLVPQAQIKERIAELKTLDVDDYVSQTVLPSESQSRVSAKAVLAALPVQVLRREEMGPLLMQEVMLDFGQGQKRRLGIIAQERSAANGVWMPEHHFRAAELLRDFVDHNIPVITFMDTPGADAGELANCANQAHSISQLIAEFAQATVPTVGIVLGNGYSGGAIPLATTNLLLTVRDGVFNTIQPRGLASISRKYNLSWQECAKYVGVSAFELTDQGYVDGIIDFVPGDDDLTNLVQAIVTGIRAVEAAAVQYTAQNPEIAEHHQRTMERFCSPSIDLQQLQNTSALTMADSPTTLTNIYGVTYRYMRFLSMRKRIRHNTLEHYGNLAEIQLPKGDLDERTAKENREVFQRWLDNPFEIKYDDDLRRRWLKYTDRRKHIGTKRTRVGQFFLGDPDTEWGKALKNMCLDYAFHLYNLWKDSAANNFMTLIDFLLDESNQPTGDEANPTVLDVILQPEVRFRFIKECQNLLILDKVYNNIVASLKSVAQEAKDSNEISKSSIAGLIDSSTEAAVADLAARLPKNENIPASTEAELIEAFGDWLLFFAHLPRRVRILKEAEQWKKMVFPRVPEPLFALLSFMFERIIPSYLDSQKSSKHKFNGKLTIRNIGIKDFWNRLEIAYHDLLIQNELVKVKIEQKKNELPIQQRIIERFFTDFDEINGNLISADPAEFPGFRIAIEQSIQKGIAPCGAVTGIAKFKYGKTTRNLGILVSNSSFQAGAWDMAATEKFCKLLVACAQQKIPVVCFVSSSGMNTKEGAGALFSMSIINDRITRFIRDTQLPIIMFGFGDCTGGAQASFVTHPLVQSYYFSGTNMPFAGQVVVPAYLPSYSTLSNYLSLRKGAMQGLVKHPFAEDLDVSLRTIDNDIPIPTETIEDVMDRVLKGVYSGRKGDTTATTAVSEAALRKPVKRVLIHARGCPCVKLVKKAIEHGVQVVLVQSDPDMDSIAAQALTKNDTLICLGGSTSDESYLNAKSVIRIAEREGCDSLHPGIGFLSENPDFADMCKNHGLNFVGPMVKSMEWMGNKSNATNTARRLEVPVVPGSFGVLTNAESAAILAEEIGYPVILKAVHGGGGKGIKVVHDRAKFRETFLQIAAEAKSAFGSSDIYMEKFVESMRHVEIQILRDSHGNTKVLGLRDCSVQRNNQKVIEESGSTLLPKKLEKVMYKSAEKLADEVDYVGAGTVEFIFSLRDQAVYFMEMNTRLQIEHPVTEKVTNTDIVGKQFEIAGGGDISDMTFTQSGYAIELRITAERTVITPDGEIEFVPDPGVITEYNFPEPEGIEVLSAIDQGQVISPYYDSMVMQLICTGKKREDTIDKLLEYLDTVTLKGVCTNIPLLKRILADEQFRGGDYDTGYLPTFLARIDIDELIKEVQESAGDNSGALDLDALRIDDSNEIKVLSQGAGVFYTTPSPTEPEFAKVGDIVTTSQTICLMEAMKLFRPLCLDMYNAGDSVIYDPDQKYKIVRINPANNQAVNKGDLLFVIEPVE